MPRKKKAKKKVEKIVTPKIVKHFGETEPERFGDKAVEKYKIPKSME